MSQTAKPGADRRRIPVAYIIYLVQLIAISFVFGTLLVGLGSRLESRVL